MSVVTVALPVLDGGDRLAAVLDAVRAQDVDRELELLVCDSGSTDGSVEVAREHGARLLQIERADFSHGATRNLLMTHAAGEHVAFLTQDSRPLTATWLATLLAGFGQAPDVALTYGPYRACPGASATTARDIAEWFAALAPDGRPRIDRLAPGERDVAASALLGAPAFFSDVNGAVAKAAWREVPFRDIPYAEDQQLGIDMLRAGYAKVYLPDAAVEHSHEYSPRRRVQRAFDEARALREVFGWAEALDATLLRDRVLAPARADVRWARAHGAQPAALAPIAARALVQHAARTAGAALGGRHDRLPAALRRRLSLESRATFEPIDGARRAPADRC
jgi:rhamnosyltransferase